MSWGAHRLVQETGEWVEVHPTAKNSADVDGSDLSSREGLTANMIQVRHSGLKGPHS